MMDTEDNASSSALPPKATEARKDDSEIPTSHSPETDPPAVKIENDVLLRRVAIVDFDVHHGQGTQNLFYEDPDVLFIR